MTQAKDGIKNNKPDAKTGPGWECEYKLRGEKGREQRYIEIRRIDGGDTDLRHLNLYWAAPELLAALNAWAAERIQYGHCSKATAARMVDAIAKAGGA